MKNFSIILALIGIIMSCSESPITGTGEDVVTGSSTIFGKLLTDGETADEEATVSLYRRNSGNNLAKTEADGSESLIATMETDDAAYSFDSLAAGTYRIEVTRQGIVIGGEEDIELDEDEDREINITIVFIINQTFNIAMQQNVTINNFIIENGQVTVSDDGYVLVFAETDTFTFAIEIDNDGETETVEVVSVQDDDGNFTVEPAESTDAIAITTTRVVIDEDEAEITAAEIDAATACPITFENSSITYEINEALTITSDCEVVLGPDITVDVNKPITVNDGGTLKIKEGTMLRFASTAYISVGPSGTGTGTLIATGTESDSVRFAPLASSSHWGWDTSPSKRAGIRLFEEASSACSLMYCSIKSSGVGVKAIDSRVTIGNSTITACVYSGVQFTGIAGPAGPECFHDNVLMNNEEYGIEIPATFTGYIDSTCSIHDNTGGGILISGSNITEDAVWNRFEDPYMVSGGIVIGSEDGAQLTIRPGSRFYMNAGATFTVGTDLDKGTLIANGTAADSIAFTSISATASWGAGGASSRSGGFFFQDGASEACSLTYCIITNAYSGIIVNNCAITVANCRISNCHWDGIRFNESAHPIDSAAFVNNIITGNEDWGVVIFADHAGKLSGTGSFVDNGEGGILIQGDNVQTSALWKKHDVPYCMSGGTVIGSEDGTILTIEPGTAFKMIGAATIKVGASIEKGTLIANGTPDDSITFSSKDPDAHWGQAGSAPTGGAIWFNSGATEACSLTYCIINQATTGIVGDNATLTISHCRISNCRYYGIRFEDGASPADSASFIDNTITGNEIFGLSLYANYVGTLSGTGTFADNGEGGILIHGDVIDHDAAWKKHDAYYVVEGQLSIGSAEGATLTIRPGATFLMDDYNTFIKIGDQLNGTLIANGAEEAPITFAARAGGDKWGYSGAQSTAGAIIIYNGGTGTSFAKCIVDNASTGFRIIDAEPTITDCEITNSKFYGMYLDGCEGVNINGNSFSGNAEGDTYVKN